ncbi:TIGR04002 family protein [Sporanaerobium hydrogeniformans]|uniref:TIGR04002 family protein n=1 Tax=Sporanaerobium hydrogeniformans TaxID=3072179 RepID=A0AC61D8V3_9FIRM|nr:TIGR04002 family protein [Sporanaerobium hydrogeniformans]PHV69205.1 TIGR04002 family protein [Sporanaerobium hydrogeniformans]
MKQNEKTRLVVMTALFAAITFVGTRINIPIGGNNHIIHVGDAVIYLAACLLPMPYAMASGAIGAGLADFTTPGCIIWMLPTMLIKPLLVPYFTCKANKFITKRHSIGLVLAGLTGTIGYIVAEGIIYGNFIAAFATLPAGLLQPIGSATVFLAVGYTFDTLHLKAKLKQQLKGDIG